MRTGSALTECWSEYLAGLAITACESCELLIDVAESPPRRRHLQLPTLENRLAGLQHDPEECAACVKELSSACKAPSNTWLSATTSDAAAGSLLQH